MAFSYFSGDHHLYSVVVLGITKYEIIAAMSDILIVGGGLAGLLAAREFVLAGADVTVVERGELARESSWAGGGILSPLYPWRYPTAVTALAAWGQPRFEALAAELLDVSGIDPEFIPSGLLMRADADVDKALQWATQQQVHLERIDAAASQRLEPQLNNGFDALWMPQIGQIRNPRLMQSLVKYLEIKGVSFQTGTPVTALNIDADAVTGVTTTTGSLSAAKVVVASGAWSRALLEKLGPMLNVEPVRGQMLLFKTEPGLVKHIIMVKGHYLIPRRDGHVLVGSTMERVGFDKNTTVAAEQTLMAAVRQIMPALLKAPLVNHWAGLRPGTRQGIPYICIHPEVSGLFINTGQFRNGVVTGPGSARLLADIVLGREPMVNPMPYAWHSEH